mgnify:CR=1 FL=1
MNDDDNKSDKSESSTPEDTDMHTDNKKDETYVIYGLDADLIMLSLVSNKKQI